MKLELDLYYIMKNWYSLFQIYIWKDSQKSPEN